MEPRSLTTQDNHLRYWRTMPVDAVRAALGPMPEDA
jgi:hypothetical protein